METKNTYDDFELGNPVLTTYNEGEGMSASWYAQNLTFQKNEVVLAEWEGKIMEIDSSSKVIINLREKTNRFSPCIVSIDKYNFLQRLSEKLPFQKGTELIWVFTSYQEKIRDKIKITRDFLIENKETDVEKELEDLISLFESNA